MKVSRNIARLRKHRKIRSHLQGSAVRPRISVFRSHRNFSAQLIDDQLGKTLLSASTYSQAQAYHGNIASAIALAKTLAQKMQQHKISKVVFDRSGYLYHGRVKAFAETLRQEGIEF